MTEKIAKVAILLTVPMVMGELYAQQYTLFFFSMFTIGAMVLVIDGERKRKNKKGDS